MADHAEQIASEVKDALDIAEVVTRYFLDKQKWDRLIENRPQNLLPHVETAATDIGHDMLLEAGFFFDEEVADFVNSLLTMFETGFRYGAAFQAEPSNHPPVRVTDPDEDGTFVTTKAGHVYRLADDIDPGTFLDMMEKAYDALKLHAAVPDNAYNKGMFDMSVEMLRSILHIDERDAYFVVLEYAIGVDAEVKNQ